MLFDTFTNNVSFLYLFLFLIEHLFKCVAYCIFILLLCTLINLYVGFPFFFACSFICASSGSFVRPWTVKNFFWNLKSRFIVSRFYLISPSVGRTFCHSTKCLILYHFVLCTWCCFANHFKRLYIYTYIYIYIRLKIKPNSVRIRFFCSSLDGIWTHTIDTLQHHSLSLTSSALDHSTTFTPLKRSFNNLSVTFSLKANLEIDVRHVYKRVYMVHIHLILQFDRNLTQQLLTYCIG